MTKTLQTMILYYRDLGMRVDEVLFQEVNKVIEQAEHRHVLQDRLQKRGTERKRMINTLRRNKRKIEKLEWNLMVSKGVADMSMESNRNNYERANKLEKQNKRYREAMKEAKEMASCCGMTAVSILDEALEGEE